MHISISTLPARQFLLRKQLLLPPQSLSGKSGIATIFDTLRLIQYDPLNPCGRNVDLVLQARVKGIHPDDYYHWLYTERRGIDCYDKELCIIPIEDLPLTSHLHTKAQRHTLMAPFIKSHAAELENLLKKVDKDGPICSSDIMDKRRINVYWSEAQWGRVALETLWKIGRLVITKREHGRKYYDLPHKAYGKKYRPVANQSITIAKEHVLRRLASVGILPASGTGGGWQGVGTGKEVSSIIRALVGHGRLTEVKVANVKQTYVTATSDLDLINKPYQTVQPKSMIFLAPLDNLLWDRTMISNFFGFDYRWEVYTPAVKRKYGYYALPILYGDELVGRIEPVLNKDKNLEIKGFWKEKQVTWTKDTWEALKIALSDFKLYLNAHKIINTPKR